ncbi:tRNA (cytidine(34)-2'-O)-methyltransferase [Azoarcus olearius]|nr:tRNA (cytidine(34)-2'-O)-methyltransferase [Azoarcus olearius]
MFHIILFEPEIPPNTGNIIRLAANTGCHLHLVEPLGFVLTDKALARAGLDYHDLARVTVHTDWPACRAFLGERRVFALTTRAQRRHDTVDFRPGDAFLFGPESRGLPPELRESLPPEQRLRLPMVPSNRSMNLSNAVAVMVFEAWRQQDFVGAGDGPQSLPVEL